MAEVPKYNLIHIAQSYGTTRLPVPVICQACERSNMKGLCKLDIRESGGEQMGEIQKKAEENYNKAERSTLATNICEHFDTEIELL